MYNKYFKSEEELNIFNRTGNLLNNVKRVVLKDYHIEKMTEDIVLDRLPPKGGCFRRDLNVYYYDAENNVIFNVKESQDELEDFKDGENNNTKYKYGAYIKNNIEYIVVKNLKPKANIIEIPDEIDGKPVFYANISQRDDIDGKELILGRNMMSTAYMQYVGRKLSKLTIPDNSITPIKELLSPIREFLSESMFKENLIINDKRVINENGFLLSSDKTKLYYVYPTDEVTIPSEVEEVCDSAFISLKKKAKIHCPSSLKVCSIYANPNQNYDDRNICDVPVDNLEIINGGIVKYIDNTIGEKVKEITNDAAVYLSDKDIICRSKNFVYQDGCVLSLDKKELVVCCIKPSAKTIILPSYITSVYKNALDSRFSYFVQDSQKDLYDELKEKGYKVKYIKNTSEKISTKLEFEVKNNRCRIVNNIKADKVEVDLSLFDPTSKKKFFINDCCLKIKELIIPEGIDEVTISNSVFVAENPELEIIHLPSTVKLQSLFASLSNLNSLMLVVVNPSFKIRFVHHKLPFIIGCINENRMRRYVTNELWFNDYDRPNEMTYINNFDRSQLIITDNAYYYKHAKSGCKLLKIKPVDSFVCPKKVGDIKVLSIAPYAFTNLKYKNYFIPEGINYTELFYRDQFGEKIIYTGAPNKNYPPRSSGSLSEKDAIDSQATRETIIPKILPDSSVTKNSIVEPVEDVKPELTEELKKESIAEEPIVEDDKANVTIEENKTEEIISTTTTTSKVNIATDINDFVINKGLLKKYTGKDKDVVIPDGIEIIGGNSFINNKKIESVIIPDGVKEIRRAAFSGCINLKSVVLPSTITIIHEAAFEHCDNLYFKELPFSLKKIDCKIKIDQSVKSLVVPEGVEKLGFMALGGEYEEIYLPKSLMDLNYAALDSKVLKKIVVDPNNKVYDSRDDSNAVIETKTNTILIGCCGTIIPGSVKVIGEEAFEGKNITKLDIPDGVEKIGYIGLMYTELLKEINVSKTVVDMDTALDDEYLEHISVSRDNPVYYSDDNHTALIKKDNNKLLYLCKNKLIPNSVKIIGKNSIYSDSDYLVIPEGVEEIETDAFFDCSIYNYVLPSSLKVVKKDAFPSVSSENGKVTIMAIKSEMNMIPGGFENDWINYNQYEITWKEALNGKSKITEDDLKSRYYISCKCTSSKVNVSILKEGTFIFSEHHYYFRGDSKRERPRIGVIEHGITDGSEYYRLYKDLNDREFCGNDASKLISIGILKEDTVYTKRIHGFDLLLKGEVNFDESSRKMKEFVDKIINYYGKDNIKVIEVDKRINKANNNINTTNYNNTSNNSYNSYNSNKYTTSPKKSGCYIATCVYGSYDCKEVWRLRRYRDYYLDNHWFGRIFIKLYYSISPTLVKLFGNKKWFKKISKKLLDKKIVKLIKKGYEDTPYNDKY